MFQGLLKLSTARNAEILMIDSADHITGKTGLTLTITASKDGAAFASITPTVTDLGSGWYNLALTTTHTNTLGDFALHLTSAGADPADYKFQVTSDLPGVVLGDTSGITTLLSRIPSAISLSLGMVTVGTNNDKTGYTVSTVSDKTGYSLSSGGIQAIWDALTSALSTVGTIGKLLVTNIDAAISSRSSYSGGAVASVTAGVTVTTNNDKTGYTVSTNSDKTGYTLTAGEHTAVVTDVNLALDAGGTELSSLPTVSSSLRSKINFVFQYLFLKRTVTGSTETILKNDGTTSLGTSALSDDGTTFTKGKVS